MKTAALKFSLLLLVTVATQVYAQSDDFNDNNDVGWLHYAPLTSFGAPTTFILGNGAYGILPTASPDPALYGPALGGSFRDDALYSDFFVGVDLAAWDDNLDQSFGLAARVSDLGRQTTDGYLLTYDTSGLLVLSRMDNEIRTTLDSAVISLVAPPFIDLMNSYRLTLIGVGGALIGAVFDLDNLATPLAQVMAVDASYTSGINGLMVFATDQTHGYATFDNYNAVVPEPSVWSLVAVGGLTLLWAFGRAVPGRAND